ncbi:MAG: hypothetical protein KGL48_13860, partial [Sphingomonadales bacterium]|nr:hypothetical protein [Sphingomonadales bacterium]
VSSPIDHLAIHAGETTNQRALENVGNFDRLPAIVKSTGLMEVPICFVTHRSPRHPCRRNYQSARA